MHAAEQSDSPQTHPAWEMGTLTMSLRDRMREREMTAFVRGFTLAIHMIVHGKEPTTAEIADLLGYASYSGAARIMDRSDLPGVVREGNRYVFCLDPEQWPY